MDRDKNPGIQVARAIAALSVAYFHSYTALRIFPETSQHPIPFLKDWGFLGVNFFFAISGYVICLVASKPTFGILSFAIKRAFRIYPMYWLVMTAIALLILIGRYPPQELTFFAYSVTLLPQKAASAYDISWTLERELVFYALAATVIPIAGIKGLAVLLALLAYLGYRYSNPWSFHLLSTAQADFLGGVIVFLLSRHIMLGSIGSALTIAGGVAMLFFTRSHDFPFSATISLAIILMGMIHLKLSWKHWSVRWVILVGDASYSIYLWHMIAFLISFIFSFKVGTLPAWLCEPWRYGAIVCCTLFSYLTWRRVEVPMIEIGDRFVRSRFQT